MNGNLCSPKVENEISIDSSSFEELNQFSNEISTDSSSFEEINQISNGQPTSKLSGKPFDDVITISSSEEESDDDDIIFVETNDVEESSPSKFEPRFEQFDLPLENGFDEKLLDNDNKPKKIIKKEKTIKKNVDQVDNNTIKVNSDTKTTAYYEIKELHKFFRRMKCVSYSDSYKTGKFSWRIKAFPVYSKDKETKNLGFHIQCVNDEREINLTTRKYKKWSCWADAKLILVNQIPGKEDLEFDFSIKFTNKMNTFGPVEYITLEKLLDASLGYLKNGIIKLRAEIKLRKSNNIIVTKDYCQD